MKKKEKSSFFSQHIPQSKWFHVKYCKGFRRNLQQDWTEDWRVKFQEKCWHLKSSVFQSQFRILHCHIDIGKTTGKHFEKRITVWYWTLPTHNKENGVINAELLKMWQILVWKIWIMVCVLSNFSKKNFNNLPVSTWGDYFIFF